MKAIDSLRKIKAFNNNSRASKSLHLRNFKQNLKSTNYHLDQTNHNQLMICLVYKKKKISFFVPHDLQFEKLNAKMYEEMFNHLVQKQDLSNEKIQTIMNSISGFQSMDGDINFDYRLSLNKGNITKTKFFSPFMQKKNSQQSLINYKMYNCLAIGGFSKVYLARSYQNGKFYAIKFIKKGCLNDTQQKDKSDSLMNQINISKDMEHPFLVKLLHAFDTKTFFCMVFEYCPGGELFYLLKKVKIMQEQIAKFYFLQILYGIQHLHSKSILYRDLKPQNILLDEDGNCKIVDFGLSKRIQSKSKAFSYCGSAEYMAPQMILRSGHSFGIDYYSLGALLYELVTGLPPFYTKDHDELQENIICKEIYFPDHIPLSNEIKDLLSKLLKKDEKQRLGSYIGIKEIIFHPWIGKIKSAEIVGKNVPCPYPTNLKEYNFDTTELGEDESQFTAEVHSELNRILRNNNKQLQYHESYKSKSFINPFALKFKHLMEEHAQTDKQNREKCRNNLSMQKLRTKLNKISQQRQKHTESDDPFVNSVRLQRGNSNKKLNYTLLSHYQKRERDIRRLHPYLECQNLSPKNKKLVHNFQKSMNDQEKKIVDKQLLKKVKYIKNNIEN